MQALNTLLYRPPGTATSGAAARAASSTPRNSATISACGAIPHSAAGSKASTSSVVRNGQPVSPSQPHGVFHSACPSRVYRPFAGISY